MVSSKTAGAIYQGELLPVQGSKATGYVVVVTPQNPPPPGNREKMRDAVQALVQKVADDKAQTRADKVREVERKRHKQRNRYLQAALLLVLLILSSMYGLRRWRQPFTAPTGADAERDARKTLVFAATLLDRYQSRTGQAPGSLALIGVALPGVIYQPMRGTWVLSMRVEGRSIDFHKGDDPARFLSGH